MTDEPKLYTQQEMDDVLEFKNNVIAELDALVREGARLLGLIGYDDESNPYEPNAWPNKDVVAEFCARYNARPWPDIVPLDNQLGALVVPDELYDAVGESLSDLPNAPPVYKKSEYERSISPPGSGLDGLQADIDRTEG